MQHNNNIKSLTKEHQTIIEFCLENRFKVNNGEKPMCPDELTERLRKSNTPFQMELNISKMYEKKCEYEIEQNVNKLKEFNENFDKIKNFNFQKINKDLCKYENNVNKFK